MAPKDNAQNANTSTVPPVEVITQYDVLKVDKNASYEDLKKAALRRIKETHPDNFMKKDDQGNVINEFDEFKELEFKRVQEAREDLGLNIKDKEEGIRQRQEYDRLLNEFERQQAFVVGASVYTKTEYPPAPEGSSFIVPQDQAGAGFSQSPQLGAGAPQLGSGVSSLGSGAAKMATNKVAKLATKEALKQATEVVAKEGAKKATQMAATASTALVTGGSSLAAQLAINAGLWAAAHAKDIGKGLFKTMMAIQSAMIAAPSAAISGAGMNLGFATVILPAVIVVMLIIMNANAYIVPIDQNAFNNVDDSPFVEIGDLECFKFDESWEANPTGLNNVRQAIPRVLGRPGARNRICSGDIEVRFQAIGLLGGGITLEGGRAIAFSHLGAGTDPRSGPNSPVYTLAHELGHVLNHRYPRMLQLYQSMSPISAEGYLPSYSLTKSPSEDMAEAIGLWLMIPTPHSQIGNFQTNYPVHYRFANTFFTE